MIGLDIGSKFIKMCQVEKRGEKYYDASIIIKEVPVSTEKETTEEAISKVIRLMYKESDFSTKEVASCSASSQVLIRNLTLPILSYEEIESSVRLETERLLATDTGSMDIDFQVLPRDNEDKMEVLLVAAPREEVDKQMVLIQNAGLDVIIMDIDNIAMANCFLAFEQGSLKRSVVLLNVGHSRTSITILHSGKFGFAKNINFGGKDISSEIERELKVSPAKAAQLKEQPDLWSEIGLNIKNILRRSTPDLLEAVYRSIEYCKSQKMFQNVDRILLAGGTSYLPSFDDFIGEIFGITTQRWNPLLNIEQCENKKLGQFMCTALGLAVRNV